MKVKLRVFSFPVYAVVENTAVIIDCHVHIFTSTDVMKPQNWIFDKYCLLSSVQATIVCV